MIPCGLSPILFRAGDKGLKIIPFKDGEGAACLIRG